MTKEIPKELPMAAPWGSLFLTAVGAPYDFRWRRLSPEPFEVVMVLLGLSPSDYRRHR
jgi:hypothetical protein